MMRCDEVSNAEGSFGGCGVERRRERGGAMKLAGWMDGTGRDATRRDGTRRDSDSDSDEGTESSERVKRCDGND